jgi:XTP/dITP diphosphohydrolase
VTAKLVLATRNAHKVAELRAILADADPRLSADLLIETVVGIERFEVADVVESGVTFEANALLKARAAAQATGLPAVADDSGLCVDVLGSAPGVFSARWAGRHGADDANLRLLLDQLADVPDEHRGAAFVCAIALVHPDGRTIVEHGRLPGVLTRAPRGAGGFGYDPILQVPDAEKNAVSHRGRAVRAIAPEVAQILLG